MLARPLRSAAFVALFLACTVPALAQSNSTLYGQPHWQIELTDFGYSDFALYALPPFPADALHEMLSGEWAAAILYDGLPEAMWLEPNFIYPEWGTNSTFFAEQPISFEVDNDGDGILDGLSVVSNSTVRIRLEFTFKDTLAGVAMGLRGGAHVLSDRYVLIQTYTVTNVTAQPLNNVRLFQFMHPHPANTEVGTVEIVYDPDLHADGSAQDHRYDVTGFAQNSGYTDNFPSGSVFRDHVNFSSSVTPADWGLGHYREHFTGKPPCGLHCSVESNTLANELAFGPDQVAGATMWDLGNLAPNASATVAVQLAVRSEAHGVPAAACMHLTDTGGDPLIRIVKGPCEGGAPAVPFDVASGSLAKIFAVGEFIALFDLRCAGQAVAMDRIPLPDDAHLSDALFYVARRSAPFTAWGHGSDTLCPTPPCPRVAVTSPTAPDLDICP
ncbi:MAG: hypothetical protein KBD01_20310 [Acidobacteria bacterium]|nr:hypothetical protein [Acidobacteriota bacterium]